MSKRLPEGDRVRSIVIDHPEIIATTVAIERPLASYTFQDDVTVIGFELTLVPKVLDAHSNTDTMLDLKIELTRQATKNMPGALGRLGVYMLWNGLFSMGGQLAKELVVMFPKGKGVEIDEGEVLNLIGDFSYIGAGGTITTDSVAIVYYTER